MNPTMESETSSSLANVEVPSPVAPSERLPRAKELAKNYMLWSMGAGLIPYPFADVFAVAAVQLRMIEDITALYDLKFSETRGKAIVASLLGGLVANTIARGSLGSLLKIVPVVGTFVGSISVPIFAGAATYAVGQVFIMHFETGGTLLDFDASRMNGFFHDQFEEGKSFAQTIKEK